jgi:hypothetical protein
MIDCQELSEKQLKKKSVEKRIQNITMNLREENDRAAVVRRSQRLNTRKQ